MSNQGSGNSVLSTEEFFEAWDNLPAAVRRAMNEAPYTDNPVSYWRALKAGRITVEWAVENIRSYHAKLIQAQALEVYGPTHPQAGEP